MYNTGAPRLIRQRRAPVEAAGQALLVFFVCDPRLLDDRVLAAPNSGHVRHAQVHATLIGTVMTR